MQGSKEHMRHACMRACTETKYFKTEEIRLKNKSDDLIFQSEICAEASQISLIAEPKLRFGSRSSAKNASEWRKD